MIPLSLKLVEQEVQPGGMRKSVHVLSLTAPYTLAEIQRYAQMPPGEVLLLPPPDTEAPEDLFPQEVLDQCEEEPIEEIPPIDEGLLQGWETVKRRVQELDIRETQLAKWFHDHCGIEVILADFQQAIPPEKLTAQVLSRLCDALTVYEERQATRPTRSSGASSTS